MKAFKIEEIKAQTPGAKRVRIVYGPYKLKAAGVGLIFKPPDTSTNMT
jgi:hypothetical protein